MSASLLLVIILLSCFAGRDTYFKFSERKFFLRKNIENTYIDTFSSRFKGNNLLKTYDEFSGIKNIKCSKSNCKSPNGECLNTNFCICEKIYANLNDNLIKNNGFCLYERKYQYIAFTLEIIFSLGLGHFYCKRYFYGSCKMILCVFLLLHFKIMKHKNIEFKLHIKGCFNIFISFSLVILNSMTLIFHIYDIYGFYLNNYLDGNGISLVPWY